MDELARTKERLLFLGGLVAAAVGVGTVGYRFIEGWPLFDSLFTTILTFSTVGYGNARTTAGRVFTMFLIVVGIALFTYSLSTITAVFVEGDLSEAFRRRRMEKDILKLDGHFVVCGAGHTGGVICGELLKTGRSVVVVDRDMAAIEKLAERLGVAVPHVVGDGGEDDVLRRAGVERAAGVFAVLSTDQDNAFVVLSAKGLNPKARVLACQKTLGVREKLLRSGADGVVDPEFIGGLRLASEMVRPVTVGFLDSMLREKGTSVRFDEVVVPAGSPLVGRPVSEVKGADGGAPLLVALVPAGAERYEINPSSTRPLAGGDKLVLIGETRALEDLRARVKA